MGYRTKQREILRAFLEKNAERAFTVDEIVQGLLSDDGGTSPGRSTVYRLIGEFEKQGLVRRFFREGDRQCSFEYLDRDVCESHLHIKCAECGQLYHLSHDVSETIGDLLSDKEHVSLDMADTVLMGICEKCRNEQGEQL